MRILIDVNHPAHVHLFRHAAAEWATRGHEVLWTARDKDIVVKLMRNYAIPSELLSTYRRGYVALATEMIARDAKMLRVARKFKPDVMIGTSVTITHVAHLARSRSLYFTESNPAATKLIARLAFPFADLIVTPDAIPPDAMPAKWHRKWITYPGYHELAYLHPNHFSADPTVLEELGVSVGETYFILRLISWGASHDVGHRGLSDEAKRRLIKTLQDHGKVFVTAESTLPRELETLRLSISARRIHHALYYAKMLVGDSQTMTAEAAVLGTPAFRCNSMVGSNALFDELEHKYQLCQSYSPDEEDKMIADIENLMKTPDLDEIWTTRRSKLLSDKIDTAFWISDFVESQAAI